MPKNTTPENTPDGGLLSEKITQKREALSVMKRNARRRMMNGKHEWCDMDAKAAIKDAEAEIRDLRSLANDKMRDRHLKQTKPEKGNVQNEN